MSRQILITGSSGLVGTSLATALAARGVDVRHFDVRAGGAAFGDVRNRDRVQKAILGCDGVIHLAAVSRVVWGERDPELCWSTNVDGLRNILQSAAVAPRRPWVVFASSREVYGQPDLLPANEDSLIRPVNVYGRSKVEGEGLVEAARRCGIRACTIRLSNVFGTASDHPDRVVPAFTCAAASGMELRIDGAENTFDFTHIDDVTRGLVAIAELLEDGGAAPHPIHFVSGRPTTLGELAEMAIRIAATCATIRHAPARDFDVGRFFGDPRRAESLLGWRPQVTLEKGVSRLISAFRDTLDAGQLIGGRIEDSEDRL
jgi:nucleoside-diphosphate-sugar epimerase